MELAIGDRVKFVGYCDNPYYPLLNEVCEVVQRYERSWRGKPRMVVRVRYSEGVWPHSLLESSFEKVEA